jgi:CHAT domain-containing protein
MTKRPSRRWRDRLPTCLAAFLLTGLTLLMIPAGAASSNTPNAAGLLERGTGELRMGALPEAAASFSEAMVLLGRDGDRALRCEALIKLAHVRQMTGQYSRGLEHLEQALALAEEGSDVRRAAQIQGAMGNAHLGLGNEDLASGHMLTGLALARENGAYEIAAAILNNLGNLYARQNRHDMAAEAYRESASLAVQAGNMELAASAATNLGQSMVGRSAPVDTKQQLAHAVELLLGTEDSQVKAYGLINVGLAYDELGRQYPELGPEMVHPAFGAYSEALSVATRTGDMRTLSYAYGYLGRLYESRERLEEALELSRRAVLSAQQRGAPESLFRWHWQSGRILDRLGTIDEAIVSYRHALHELQAVREEFDNCYASADALYQRTASVVCSEMVDLLLRRATLLEDGESAQPWLEEARDTLEALKIYELRDYFRDDCIDAARFEEKRLDTVSAGTVVIYPILLPDRTELLVSFAGQLKRYTLPVGEDVLTGEVREFRRKLVKRTTWEFLSHAQTLYDWLIRPLEPELKAVAPDTLVFVPGGALRTIPMAALHDGSGFLITRYRIAVTPSLNLTDPRPLRREGMRLLSLGLTKPVQGFPGLPYVEGELAGIRRLFGGSLLLNEEFRMTNVERGLKTEPYSVLHIASHGQFGDNVDDTFILAYDERFTMERIGEYIGLFRFRDEPLDMLTLSACETAAGDDRAALGLAGVAVRAGARSALATLWHVNDPATQELILEFYRGLQDPDVTRAAALQAAQLKLASDPRYDHPGYWSPFLLINDWQ